MNSQANTAPHIWNSVVATNTTSTTFQYPNSYQVGVGKSSFLPWVNDAALEEENNLLKEEVESLKRQLQSMKDIFET